MRTLPVEGRGKGTGSGGGVAPQQEKKYMSHLFHMHRLLFLFREWACAKNTHRYYLGIGTEMQATS